MSASTGAAAILPPDDDLVDLKFDQPLLCNKRRFCTSDYSIARNYIEKTTAGLFDFSLQNAREFHGYDVRSARLGETAIDFVRVDCVSGYHIEMRENPDLILLHILMRGSAELRQDAAQAAAASGQIVVLETTARTHKKWYGSTQLFLIKLSRSRMERALSGETGVGIKHPLSFGSLPVVGLRMVPTLWHYILTICRDLNDPNPCFDSGHAGRLAERTLFMLLMNALPNNYGWALTGESPSPAAPWYVRRVEDYVRAHASEEITTEDLVKAGGASARSLYHGFRTFRSMTPMGYVKAVRLDLARDSLLKGRRNGNASVTHAAVGAGYTNLSQFSRDYKARFRETPSQTLVGA